MITSIEDFKKSQQMEIKILIKDMRFLAGTWILQKEEKMKITRRIIKQMPKYARDFFRLTEDMHPMEVAHALEIKFLDWKPTQAEMNVKAKELEGDPAGHDIYNGIINGWLPPMVATGARVI